MDGQAAQNVNRPPGASGAERAKLLARMLHAIGLDEHSTACEHPEILASLGVACKLCNSVERCTGLWIQEAPLPPIPSFA